MLSHFIILSNKMSTGADKEDGTSTCTMQVKKYFQNDKNGLSVRMLLLCYCRYYKQMMIWGYSPPRKKLKLSIWALLKKPSKTQKAFLEWPHIDLHPSYWETVVLLLLLEIE